MLFLNEARIRRHGRTATVERMLHEWVQFAPRGVEADPAYLAVIARAAVEAWYRVTAAGLITLTYRDHDARNACATSAAPWPRRSSSCTAPLKPACCSWNASTGGCIPNERHSHIDLVPLPGNAPLARVLVTTLGPAVDAAAALRTSATSVRVAETRDCACGLMSDGPVLERVEGRQSDCVAVNGETVTPLMLDDAIHLALGAAATIEQWQLVGDTLHVADPASRESAALAAEAVSQLLARPIRGEHVSGRRAGSVRQVPAGQELMRSAGFPLLERGYDGRTFHLPRQRLDHA